MRPLGTKLGSEGKLATLGQMERKSGVWNLNYEREKEDHL